MRVVQDYVQVRPPNGVFAVGGFFERDLHRVRQIAAAIDLPPAPGAGALAAKNIAKNVTKGLGKAAKTFGPATGAAHVWIDAGVAILVVGGALLRIAQHLVKVLL